MLELIKKILNDVFTEANNKYYCPVRILGTISLLHYLILATIELHNSCKDFSLTDMASGISILIGVISAGITIKSKTDQ